MSESMIGRLAPFVAGLIIVSSASGGAAPGGPKERHVASDQRWARGSVLTRWDVPPGFERDPKGYAAVGVPRCRGLYAPDRSDLTSTGSAHSYFRAGRAGIASQVSVWRTRADNEAWWERVFTKRYPICVARIYASMHAPGVRTKIVAARAIPARYRLGDRQAAYHFVIHYSKNGDTQRVVRDVFFFAWDRATASVAVVASSGNGCECAADLAGTVYTRVTRHGRAAPVAKSLMHAVLRPSQIGRGYVMRVIPGGREVWRQVTLDMCGFHFASETRRTRRLQVAYARPGSGLILSNEVVTYLPGGAASAMREIDRAIRTCPARPVPSAVRGVPPMRYRINRLSTAGRGLLATAIVIKVTVSGTYRGKKMTETSFVSYQRAGHTLSGIYVYGGSLRGRRALAFAASAQSAQNLKRF